MKQRLFNQRALKEVTNKLDPKPIKPKPSWAGPKGVSGATSRKMGSTSKWEFKRGSLVSGEPGTRDNNGISDKGGSLPCRPPDPAKSLKTSDALEADPNPPFHSDNMKGKERQEAANDVKPRCSSEHNGAEEGGQAERPVTNPISFSNGSKKQGALLEL